MPRYTSGSDGIRLVVVPTSPDPALLKPSPHLIDEAVRGLDATVLVRDSFTDIEAHRLPNRPSSKDQGIARH